MSTTLAPPEAPPDAATLACLPVCVTLLATIGQHAEGCAHYINPHGKGWCPSCRRRVQIEDVAGESAYTAVGEVGYRIEYLACGHDNSRELGVIGTAPGAPYAGVPTIPTTRTRDIAAFRRAEAARLIGADQ